MSEQVFDFGEAASRLTLSPGDTLVREGEVGTEVYQIVEGELAVERATDDGPMTVATLEAGALVGEVTNALGGTRTATLRAVTPVVVSSFTQDQFFVWLDENPDAAAQLATQARLRSNRSRAAAVLANLFGLENQDVVDAVVQQISWITLAPGDVLFEQGDESDSAYLLLAGRLHIYARNAEGEPTLDVEIGRGEIVGEMGILEEAPRSAGASAMRETTLAMISKESFELITSAYPTLMVKVALTIIDRLTHQRAPDNRARVVCLASTVAHRSPSLFQPCVDAVQPFGSALHLSSRNLSNYVRNVDGQGGPARVAEFLHEADVAHDFVMLECDRELTEWSVKAARQSDRFVLVCSAHPDAAERERIERLLNLLSPAQRSGAWIARLYPPNAKRPRGTAQFIDQFGVAELHNIREGCDDHLARLGRLATGNGRGVVLGGGGAKGLAHIGALRALKEAGLHYDRVGGASMGAAIGAFAAQDHDHETMLKTAIAEFRKDTLDFTVPLVSLMKAEKMADSVQREFGGWDITDLWIPYFCVSTNITKSQLAVHRRGALARAIRASTAIPVALPPVPIDGDLHVDGGVLDNVPVTPMHEDPSIGTVIAVDVSPPGGPAADEDYGLSVSGIDVLRARFSKKRTTTYPDIGTTLMSSMLIGSTKARNESTDNGVVDLYLDLDLSGVGLLKFENHAEIVQRGYEGAQQQISAWRAARGA